MIDYVIYDDDGRILQGGKTVESMFDQQADTEAGRHVLAGVGGPNQHWVVAGEIVERPVLAAYVSETSVRAGSTDEVLVDGVPAGAEVLIVGPAKGGGVADGGLLHFSFALPGRYHIVCKFFPYKEWEVTIDAL